ncbi:MAG: ATP-binding protein [Desulfuromonadaceae bacterium]|nr:ATP-binding protein [Desulfuromonadaceae bacterium]MDD5106973.1 ATP-binding protein [Desulfuromonadaceae bacterium]
MSFNKMTIRSLKTRVTLFTLVIFLICIWSLTFYTSRMLRLDMEHHLSEQQFSTVSVVAADIGVQLNDRIRALEAAASRITPAIMGNPTLLQTHLENRPALAILFNSGLWITGTDGIGIADVPVSTGRIGVNYSDRAFMIGALKGKTTIGQPVMGRKLLAPAFAIAAPIKDSAGNVIGVLLGAINLGMPNFMDRIAANSYGKTGGYLLISKEYRVIITATDKNRIMETLPSGRVNPLIERFLQGHEGSGIVINPRGVEVLASAKNVPQSSWYVAAMLPTKEAFAPVRDMNNRILLAAVFLTIMAWLLTRWMLKRQLAPMVIAAESLAVMSHEKSTLQPLPVTSRDEIGDLIGGFNHLLETLRQREEALHEQTVRLEKEMADRQKFHEALQNKTIELEHEIDIRQVTQQNLEEQTAALEEEVAERIRLQEEHERLEEQLLQSQKMEAIGLLAGGVAHDFNNILSVIMGYGSLLIKSLSEGKEHDNIVHILNAAERAAELTKGLLAFSRKQTFNLKCTDINRLGADNGTFLKRVIGEDIELVTTYYPTPLLSMIDSSQIQQVFMNLATNARDAMPSGGKLTISISAETVEGHEGRTGEYAVIRMSDTGTGIDSEAVEKIFDPFFTTKVAGKGTGLGLSIIHGIIAQHGGFIRCHSSIGQGTEFAIYLPLCSECGLVDAPEADQKRVSLRGSETILLAEDDTSLMEITTGHLEANGYTVIQATDGAKAVEMFEKYRDEIDLVMLDAIMPRMTGKQAWDEIREIRPDVKACFVSGYANEIISGKVAVDYGVPFISKPIMPESLLRKVREILEK